MSREALDDRQSYKYWHRIATRWSDNDVYGHVNNTVYYQWFDTTVNNWLISTGLLDLDGNDPIGLVVETGCRYAISLSFPEPVEIGLSISRLGSSSVTYRLGVFSAGSARAAAQGHFTHVYVDRNTRRPVKVPTEWRERLLTLLSD